MSVLMIDQCSCHHWSQFSYLHLASRTLHFYTIPSIPDYYCTSEDIIILFLTQYNKLWELRLEVN